MLIRDCRLLTAPPLGCALYIQGESASCGYCREVVYPHVEVLCEHDFAWDGYRMTWFSRPFGVTVHACASSSTAIEVEVHELVSA